MKRRAAVVAVLIAAGTLSLAAGLWLHSEDAWRRLLHHINAGLPGAIAVQAVGFSLLSGTITVENVVLSSADHRPIAGFKTLALSWRPWALILGKVRIDTVAVTRPWCHLETDGQGRVNLAQALSSPTDGTGPDQGPDRSLPEVAIAKITVAGGRLAFTDPAGAISAAIEGIGVDASADLKSRRAALRLETAGGRIQSAGTVLAIDSLTLAARLSDNSLHDLALALTGPHLNVAVSGRADGLWGAPVLDLHAKATVGLEGLIRQLNLAVADTSGTIEVSLDLTGGIHTPRIAIGLAYGGGRLAAIPVTGAEARLSFKDNRADLDPLTITLAGGRIRATAQADFGEALAKGAFTWPPPTDRIRYRAHLVTDELALERLSPAQNPWQGRLKVDVTAEGMGADSTTLTGRATLKADAKNIRVAGQRAPVDARVMAEATADRGLVTISRLLAQAADTRVEAAGTWNMADNRLDARIAIEAPDLERALSPVGINGAGGQVAAHGRIQGQWHRPQADIRLHAKSLAIDPWVIGNAQVMASLSPEGLLSVTSLEIDNNGSRINGAGTLVLPWVGSSAVPMAFGATLTGVDIAAFAPRRGISGRLDGNLSLNGPWPNAQAIVQANAAGVVVDRLGIGALDIAARLHGPRDWPVGTVTITARDLFWEDQRFSGLILQARSQNSRWQVDRLEAALTPEQRITGSGWVAPAGAFSLRLDAAGLDLDNFARIRDLGPIQGVVTAAVEAGGHWRRPDIAAKFGLTRIRFQGLPLADASFTLRAAKGRASLAGDFYGAIQASLDLDKGPITARWDLETDHLAPLLAMAGIKGLDGRLTALLDVSANTAHWAQMTADASIRRLELHQDQRHLIRARPFDLRLKAQHLYIPNLEIVLLENGRLTLSGSIGADGPIDLAADGAVPLAVIEPFTPDLTGLNGQILIRATAKGTITEPHIDGELRLDQVGLTLPVLDQKLHGLNALVRISPGALTIATAAGLIDQSPFTLAGRADLKGLDLGALSLALKAEDLTFRLPETLWLRVGLDIGLEGTWDRQVLAGTVVLREGLYHKPVRLSLLPDTTGRRKALEGPPPPDPADPLLNRTGLDLTITAQAPLMVDNNLARMAVVPDMRLGGTLARPVLTGQAEVAGGTLRYQRRVFDVTHGTVAFTNPYRTEPDLDIEATTRVRQWDIFLNLTGTPDRLDFAMRSQPAEDEADIVSLLLLGRTKAEMIGAEGGVTQSAGQMLAELIATRMADDIKQTTGLDIVDVAAAGGDARTAEGTRVTLGKTLSPRMTVKVETDTGAGEIQQRAVAEYRLLEGLMVKGFQDSLGRYGGALQYRLEFR